MTNPFIPFSSKGDASRFLNDDQGFIGLKQWQTPAKSEPPLPIVWPLNYNSSGNAGWPSTSFCGRPVKSLR